MPEKDQAEREYNMNLTCTCGCDEFSETALTECSQRGVKVTANGTSDYDEAGSVDFGNGSIYVVAYRCEGCGKEHAVPGDTLLETEQAAHGIVENIVAAIKEQGTDNDLRQTVLDTLRRVGIGELALVKWSGALS